MRFTRLAIAGYRRMAEYCEQHPDQAGLVERELEQSISTADLLDRQLKMEAKAAAELNLPNNPA